MTSVQEPDDPEGPGESSGFTDGGDAFPRWLGPGLLAVAGAALAAWSWGKWTDVHIDFGNELYIAWRLSEGDALYRDIAHRNGPLSHYVDALWFLLFGVSVKTLVYCNLLVLAAVCAMTYRIFRASCNRLTATSAGLVLLGVFGFSQYVSIANYNFVTPYHHFQTHGLALGIAMIAAFGAALGAHGMRWCAVAGACLGLVLLTKAELAVPAAATAALGLALVALGEAGRLRRSAGLVASFTVAAVLPPVVAWLALRAQMSSELAWTGVLGNWSYLGGVFADRFYAVGAGFDDVGGNLRAAVVVFVGTGMVAGLLAALDRWPSGRSAAASAMGGVALFALLVAAPGLVPWAELARGLPFVCLVAAVLLLTGCLRHRRERAVLRRLAPLALWSVYALGLLGKMILNARFHHYGFALAMPAALLLVAAFVYGLPSLLARRAGGAGGRLARSLAIAGIAAGIVFFVRWSDRFYAGKDFAVGSGRDAIVVDSGPRARQIARALDELRELVAPDSTLLVLPEGIGLNYWLRLENPTRYNLFLPAELAAFGGDGAMLENIRAHPPDFVVLVHRPSAEFGVGPFGVDPRNGRELMDWVRTHYRRVGRIGEEPFGRRFGIVILRRS